MRRRKLCEDCYREYLGKVGFKQNHMWEQRFEIFTIKWPMEKKSLKLKTPRFLNTGEMVWIYNLALIRLMYCFLRKLVLRTDGRTDGRWTNLDFTNCADISSSGDNKGIHFYTILSTHYITCTEITYYLVTRDIICTAHTHYLVSVYCYRINPSAANVVVSNLVSQGQPVSL